MRKLDNFYMAMAWDVSQLSRCVKRRVGAVAVKDDSILDFSYNGTCSGWWTNSCEDKNGNTTEEVLHAEENIVAKCAKNGRSMDGCTVFITYAPCKKCARLMYQSGVAKVVFDESNDKGGIEMLLSLGVEVVQNNSLAC